MILVADPDDGIPSRARFGSYFLGWRSRPTDVRMAFIILRRTRTRSVARQLLRSVDAWAQEERIESGP